MTIIPILQNDVYNTHPVVLHSPPNDWGQALKLVRLMSNPICCPLKNITIITWNNQNTACTFEKSLARFGFLHVVLGKGIVEWKNIYKVHLLNSLLANIKTKYVLAADGFDAVCVGDINKAIAVFEQMPCELLFNASPFFGPNVHNHPMFLKCRHWQAKKFRGTWRFLNAGAWMGTTSFCREFWRAVPDEKEAILKEAKKWGLKDSYYERSEQARVQYAFPKFYPKATIDSKCQIFQVVHNSLVYPTSLRRTKGISFPFAAQVPTML